MTYAFSSTADAVNLPAFERLIGEVSDLQSKLILLVGNSGKTRLLRSVARRLNSTVVNVGVELGRRLAAPAVMDRGFSTNELLRETTDKIPSNGPLLLDNIEILFEPSLKINPLNIIKLLAHSRLVVAAWPGEMRSDRLIYAGMGHPENRDYSRDGVFVFETAQSQQGAGRSKA